jgi:phosphoglucomutase
MKISPLAGIAAPTSMLVNVPRLVTAYFADHPDASVASERIAFGTSGHRGSAFERTFNEAHILAIAQAICSYRHAHGIDGPLFMGMDTHGTEEIYKLYAESFRDRQHLERIQTEAQALVSRLFAKAV